MKQLKFQALTTYKTVGISKAIPERLITPHKVIEMRWIAGDKWCQAYAEPGTNWKALCRLARAMRNDFKAHLQGQI